MINLTIDEELTILLALKMLQESFLKEGKDTPTWLTKIIDKVSDQTGSRKFLGKVAG